MSNTERLATGAVLHDRYEIRETLGAGGFAVVYAAFDRVIERDVAIKVLNSEHLAGSDRKRRKMLDRFLREARVAARIRHSSIIEIYDFGVLGDDGHPYIIMEFLEGHDLGEELIEHGPMEPSRLFPLFIDALDALDKAHAEGVVHKDLKPANLFLEERSTRNETLKIVDFGIAHVQGQTEDRITKTGAVSGTPQYLAPEYIEDQTAEAAMDIYQMGLILVEALVGTPVIETSNLFQAAIKHVEGDVEIPRPILDTPVGDVVEKATAHNPAGRFATAEDFADALASIDPKSVTLPESALTKPTAGDQPRDSQADDDATRSWAAAAGLESQLTAEKINELESAPTLAQSEVEGEPPSHTAATTSEVAAEQDETPESSLEADVEAEDDRRRTMVLVLGAIFVTLTLTVGVLAFYLLGAESTTESTDDDGEEARESAEIEGLPPQQEDAGSEVSASAEIEPGDSEEQSDPKGDEPDRFTVEVTSTPDEATLEMSDGTTVGTTPEDVELEDDERLELRMLRDGYLDSEFTVDADSDENYHVELTPEPEPHPPAPPPQPEQSDEPESSQDPPADKPGGEDDDDRDDANGEDDDGGLRLAP